MPSRRLGVSSWFSMPEAPWRGYSGFAVVTGVIVVLLFGSLSARAMAAVPQRHYELVSAADTNGIEPTPDVAAADGESYAYATFLPTPPDPLSGSRSFYVSTRASDGTWTQSPVNAPAPSPGQGDGATNREFFSADLAYAIFNTSIPVDPDDQNGSTDVYLRSMTSGGLTWLSRDPSIMGPQNEPGGTEAAYISPDGRAVLFYSKRPLLPGMPTGVSELYGWADGALTPISRVPVAGTSCDDIAGPACAAAASNSRLGSGSEPGQTTYGAVSSDGSRVVFTSGGSNPRLYVRIGGRRTVEASAGAPGAPPVATPLDVNYVGADGNAEHVFFTSSSPLTVDSEASGVLGGPADLYVFDIGSESLRDITPSTGGADVKRVYAVSEDGSRIYFTSTKQLNEAGELTEEGEGLQGTLGVPNLYLAELGNSTINTTFIATVEDPDVNAEGSGTGLAAPQAWREVAASTDGSLLAFRDRLPVVPGRTTGGFPQVFVYNADSHELSCPSCLGGGAEPTTAANLSPARGDNGIEPTAGAVGNLITNSAGPHARNISTGGEVFFQTGTSLLPRDTNGKIDVYEWQGGELALISAGLGAQNSIFAGASADGSTVFFSSADSLVPGAQAGIQHIYAARVGPGASPTTPTPPCTGMDCRETAAGAPRQQGAGSSTFGGPGNFKAKHRLKHREKKRHRHHHKHRQVRTGRGGHK